MVNCRKAVDLLGEFVDGELDPEQQASLQQHFKDCPPCLDFLESYRKTARLCRDSAIAKAPAELEERLKKFLREKTGKGC